MIKRTATLLFFLLLCVSASAQRCKFFTTDDAMYSSLVNTIYQDRYGEIWIGTENGLHRYDGVKMRVYLHSDTDPSTISHNVVRAVFEDRDGHLMIGMHSGVQIYDRKNDCFSPAVCDRDGVPYDQNVNFILQRRNGDILVSGNKLQKLVFDQYGRPHYEPLNISCTTDYTNDLLEDSHGDVWFIKFNEGIYRVLKDGSARYYTILTPLNLITSLCEGPDGNIYASTYGEGLFRYNPKTDEFERCSIPEIDGCLINELYNLGDGTICIGTDTKGALIFDPLASTVKPLAMSRIPFDPAILKIHAIFKDSDGNIWLGAYQKGAIMVPVKRNNFMYLGSKSAGTDIIGSCCINSITVDHAGQLWVGTDNDGIYKLTPSLKPAAHFRLEDGIPATVFDIQEDSQGYIWFGSYTRGLWRLDPRSGKIVNAAVLSKSGRFHESVYSFAIDSRGRMWVATMGDGIHCLVDNASRRMDLAAINREINLWVDDLMLNGDKLYAGSFDGAYIIDISGEEPAIEGRVLKGKIVYCMYMLNNNIYFGTDDGLFQIDSRMNISKFTTDNNLSNNIIYDIQHDGGNQLWLSTNNGLSAFDIKTRLGVSFYVGDGLQGNEFCRGSSTKDENGNIYFGGTGGITYFDPKEILEPAGKWTTRITSLQLPDREIRLLDSEEVVLKHNDRSCIIDFSTAEYNASDGISYKYSVNGSNWATVAPGATGVTLSNLKPGTYHFSVKAVDSGMESEPANLTIKVAHAWYGTLLAKLFYLLAAAGIIAIICTQNNKRKKAEEEMVKHKQAEDLNESKLQFFMNLSHEIRTPMTLIEGPLNKLIESDIDPERQQSYALMSRNSKRILRLINQMLDMRKIDKGQMRLTFAPVNYNALVSSVCDLFREQAGSKNISLNFRYSGASDLVMWLDSGQFDKVVVNLLSNAIKFTPEGGRINVTLSNDGHNANLEVKDSGIGLPDEDLAKIFDRFYQSGKSSSGTGIGLNLSQMIVKLHHGTIKASNNTDGPGSTFTVALPMGNAHLKDEEMAAEAPMTDEITAKDIPSVHIAESGKKHEIPSKRKNVLLVEDDIDIRTYIKNYFAKDFYVSECSNGRQALDMILKKVPDLVISDIMMPEMDGLTLCKKIRKNININSIPVILLTAKAGEEDTIEGLEYGADAYITKPFNIEVLRQNALSLISSRERLKVVYSDKQVEKEKIAQVAIKTPDEKLMERVVKVINDNISNPVLTVEMVAEHVGISRVHLHRKLKELTNQTSRDFIRNIRLNKAAEMLKEKKHSIAELADAVGFSNPANFATSFKALFGMTPSEFMNQDRQDSPAPSTGQESE